MIGKGKSISHTRASIGYGWNQEKHAEIVHSQHLAGENPKQITEEFKIIQEQNQKCEKNTLSFVLSPTVEDGRDLSKKELKDLTKNFIEKMGLRERQAIAFVHRVETPDIVYHPRRVKVTIAGRRKVTHPRRAKVDHL